MMMEQETPFEPASPPLNRAMRADASQRERDVSNLRVLSILHYVWGALTLLGSCIGILYLALGLAMATNPKAFDDGTHQAPPAAVGWGLASFGGCALLLALASAGLVFYAAHCLSAHKHRVYCMVIAGISCLSIPLGTVLGIFTLVVLARPSVVELFEENRPINRARFQ